MKSIAKLLLIAALAITARAQIPSLGFCPEYLPMTGFDMERFSGIWYEAERYFQLTEVASRCVMANYTKGPDGKFHVVNEVTSRFTGIKRVLEGEIRKAPSKAEEGKLHVKYTTVPLIPLETQYNVLETDYDTYAVLWSCSGVGPVHTQNAWIMTRQRLAPGEVLQKAYGVLDKYKISKVFFVKTNQDDCAYLDSLQAEQAAKPTEPPKKNQTPQVAEAEEEQEEEDQPKPLAGKSADFRSEHITPDAPEAIIKTRKAEIAAKEKLQEITEPIVEAVVEAAEPAVAAPEENAVKSVPEVILKIADQAKELAKEPAQEPSIATQEAAITEPIKEEPAAAIADEPAAPVIAEEPKEAVPAILEEEKKPAPAAIIEEEKKIEPEPEKIIEPIIEEKIEIVKA
ncbi:apolipoprotein D-like precursor [Nasonia vitripennis]|uniref:Lipocalin/cytosolic fatty-acid binding domain-containing protein n=1 Tax=Nasonia vitripennis TaxID=7425 RepID=A0A7M6UFL2_NASVI|nr:apolipoprotein D-like precursor [Nasonia vitripennis]